MLPSVRRALPICCRCNATLLPSLSSLRRSNNSITAFRPSSHRSIAIATARNDSPLSTDIGKTQSEWKQPPAQIREAWGNQMKGENHAILRDTQPFASRLEFLVDSFKKSLLLMASSNTSSDDQAAEITTTSSFSIITAWLVSDNVLIDLFNRVAKEQHPDVPDLTPHVIAIDTLHLFPETLQTADMMKERYPNLMTSLEWVKPDKCATREDFQQLHGQFHEIPESEFDYWTKVEPLQRALKSHHESVHHQRVIVVTGRRNDQGNQRTSIPLWEEDKMTFNPLVNWSWNDITLYCQHFNIPVNPLHRRLYIDPFHKFMGKKDRDNYNNFLEVTLDHPYFYYNNEILRTSFSHHKDDQNQINFYVWKSFGDSLTSVPVAIDESEREGRFVHRIASECGIHTRVSNTKKAPHGGGVLVNLLQTEEQQNKSNRDELSLTLKLIPGVDYDRIVELNERQVCDLELLMNGGYSPLKGFMNELEYESCVHDMRLPEGSLFGLPIVLDSHDGSVKQGDRLLLRSSSMGGDLAIMDVESIWKPDKTTEALKVFNTTSRDHPYIEYMKSEMGTFYIGGPITRGIQLPRRLWLPSQYRVATPTELREKYRNSPEVLAFQCRNPLHRAHVEMFTHDSNDKGVQVVVHPSIGPSKQDDFDARVRVPTYEVLQSTLQQRGIDVYYIPYHMRLGGPRETIQHLICRKNYGFTQMITGRDHAGCKDAAGNDYYGPYEAQEMAEKYAQELGIKPVSFKQLVYVPEKSIYMPMSEAQSKSLETRSISGTEFRRRINNGLTIPEWYAFPEVVRLLESSFRYHLTQDLELPSKTSKTIGHPVIAIHLPPSSSSESSSSLLVDSKLSDQIIQISKQFPSIPFFVVVPPTTTEQQQSESTTTTTSILMIQIINYPSTTSQSQPASGTGNEDVDAQVATFKSFEELEAHLTTIIASQQ